MKYPAFLLLASLLLVACGLSAPKPPHDLTLPVAVSNNATAQVGAHVYSFGGLTDGKTWKDITTQAFDCDLSARPKPRCHELPGLPDGKGRLASAAVSLRGKVLIFGGYTVAEDGAEVTTPDVWQFDPQTKQYMALAHMPVPVDDSVALTYDDRYVYLVSGWHESYNVEWVQVYDAVSNRWSNATPYGGVPVFGHAGGIVGNVMIICGGVRVEPPVVTGGKRSFVASPDCWRGEISVKDPYSVVWRRANANAHFGYRMAAGAFKGQVVFAGGADNPYNYNGMGYDGEPAVPGDEVWAYDILQDRAVDLGLMPLPSMDHRGMTHFGPWLVIAGGLDEKRQPMKNVMVFTPKRS